MTNSRFIFGTKIKTIFQKIINIKSNLVLDNNVGFNKYDIWKLYCYDAM